MSCLLAVYLALAIAFGRTRELWAPRHRWLYFTILGWTLISATMATYRARSVRALILVGGALLLAGTIETVARRRAQSAILLLLLPAALNSALFVTQEFAIWDPLFDMQAVRRSISASGRDYSQERHLWSTAFAGSPTDLACSLLPAALATAALAATTEKKRTLYVLVTAALTGILILTQIFAAVGALTAGLVAIAIMRWPRRTLLVTPGVLIAMAICAFAYPPVQKRILSARALIVTGEYDAVVSGRLPAFEAALEMGKDHALFGVGPGCFEPNYFEYKMKAETRYPSLLDSVSRPINFGSVHNDFLDVFAETGLIGLILMIAAIIMTARNSFANREDLTDPRKTLARILSLPLAIGFSVLALAQFPLSLCASLTQFLFVAGLCRAWTGDAV